MASNPIVSVILPVYNGEAYLRDCLDSIIGQTLRDIEIMCIDDGSTDGAPAIIAEYASRDPRIKTFKTNHVGAYRARDVGIQASTGQYIYFMDADDILDSVALQDLHDRSEKDGLDQIVFSATSFCGDDCSPEKKSLIANYDSYYELPSKLCGKILAGMDFMDEAFRENGFHVSPPLRLIRASVIKDNAYEMPDATSRADTYFTPVSLYYSKRVMAIPAKYYHRRVRNDSISTEKGSCVKHMRNVLVSICALIHFPPFFEVLKDSDSFPSKFVAHLFRYAHRLWPKVSVNDRIAILHDVLANAAPEVRDWLFYTAIVECDRISDELWKERKARKLLSSELDAARNSFSFRIGSAIVWLPAMILRFVRRKPNGDKK